MKRVTTTLFVAVLMLMSVSAANAWHAKGNVFCDTNGNSVIDPDDMPVSGVVVRVVNQGMTFSGSDATDSHGFFRISLPDHADTYIETLDPATLPSDAMILVPPGGQVMFSVTSSQQSSINDWLIKSEICTGACWLTGGGVKFEAIVGEDMAQKGPQDSLGGNVNPGCNPDSGEGGQWNHVAHREKLHFQGFAVQVVRCGNVPGIEEGSESPVTPFNFIEFEGTGRLKGIKGNKEVDEEVHFFARAEDRNEPGSNGAKDGADIDRYFLNVFSDPSDPVGTSLLLIDMDGDPATVDPALITGGNLQLHISSCDNPPL